MIGRIKRKTYSTQMVPLAIDSDDAAVVLLVTDVKELIEFEAVLPAGGDVWLDIIELAEEAGKFNMPLVVEVGMAEYEDAVLSD
jgi:hypothetical protein